MIGVPTTVPRSELACEPLATPADRTPLSPIPRLMSAEKTWKLLESAIYEINNHNESGLSFEELYRYVCLL